VSAHVHHPRGEGSPTLFDGCPGCDRHALGGGLTLDRDRFREAWDVMMLVEWEGNAAYRSHNEARLCGDLYRTAVLLERYTTVDPKEMPWWKDASPSA